MASHEALWRRFILRVKMLIRTARTEVMRSATLPSKGPASLSDFIGSNFENDYLTLVFKNRAVEEGRTRHEAIISTLGTVHSVRGPSQLNIGTRGFLHFYGGRQATCSHRTKSQHWWHNERPLKP